MFQYDANAGGFPQLGDRVEIVRVSEELDGITGTIGGWGDYAMITALVALDKPIADGSTIISFPVVCLRKMMSYENHVKLQKRPFLRRFRKHL